MTHPLDPEVLVDPFAVWAAHRAADAVFHDRASRTWIVLGHREAADVLSGPAFSSQQGQRQRGSAIAMPPSMLNTDGDEHVRLRAPAGRLLGAAAARRVVALAGASIEDVVGQEPLTGENLRSVGRRCATAAFTHLLHLDEDGSRQFEVVAKGASPAVRPGVTPTQARQIGQAMPRLAALLGVALERSPDGSALRDFADDGRLEAREKVGILMLAVVGGWEPLADFIANALPLLTVHRDEFLASTDREAFEREFLRLHGPIPIVSRGAVEDTIVGGHDVARDDRVVVLLAAANRDPEIFPDPDRVSPGREAGALGFGGGTHYCLGAPLVKAAAAAAHAAILHRNPRLRVSPASPPWEASLIPRRIAQPFIG